MTAPEVISRAAAKNAGLRLYFTGKPCCAGHIAPRRVDSKKCVLCHQARAARYYTKNRETITAKNRARFAEKAEQYRETMRRYREERRDEAVERTRRWRIANPEAARAARVRRKARLKGAPGTHTKDDIRRLLQTQGHRCGGCRKSLRKAWHVDHILPIALGGSNEARNLQVLCPDCNLRKNAKHPLVWARELGRLV